jgi:hypothetical protein
VEYSRSESLVVCRLITSELRVQGLRVEQPSEVSHHAACTSFHLHKKAEKRGEDE